MSTRKFRNSWWVDFRHEHVRYRVKSPLNTEEGAELYELTLRRRAAAGEPIIPWRVIQPIGNLPVLIAEPAPPPASP